MYVHFFLPQHTVANSHMQRREVAFQPWNKAYTIRVTVNLGAIRIVRNQNIERLVETKPVLGRRNKRRQQM
jgi:hypothetical protein